ncbi:MAG: AAA family ATPase [bacterium]|nr:AAA family ATPase [bacterium]
MLVGKGFPRQHIHYFDLEDFDLLEICNQGTRRFVQYLRNLGEDFTGRCYVFMDEIQYLNDPTNFLKLLHDHYKNIKIICSGSSTLDIQRKFKDSLVGRKLLFELFPLSFEEFLSFKQQETLLNILHKYDLIDLKRG